MKKTKRIKTEWFKDNSERLEGAEDCNFRLIRMIFIRKVKSEQRHEEVKELAMEISRRNAFLEE